MSENDVPPEFLFGAWLKWRPAARLDAYDLSRVAEALIVDPRDSPCVYFTDDDPSVLEASIGLDAESLDDAAACLPQMLATLRALDPGGQMIEAGIGDDDEAMTFSNQEDVDDLRAG